MENATPAAAIVRRRAKRRRLGALVALDEVLEEIDEPAPLPRA